MSWCLSVLINCFIKVFVRWWFHKVNVRALSSRFLDTITFSYKLCCVFITSIAFCTVISFWKLLVLWANRDIRIVYHLSLRWNCWLHVPRILASEINRVDCHASTFNSDLILSWASLSNWDSHFWWNNSLRWDLERNFLILEDFLSIITHQWKSVGSSLLVSSFAIVAWMQCIVISHSLSYIIILVFVLFHHDGHWCLFWNKLSSVFGDLIQSFKVLSICFCFLLFVITQNQV